MSCHPLSSSSCTSIRLLRSSHQSDGKAAIDKEKIGLIWDSSATLLDGSDFTDGELYSLTAETRAESHCVQRIGTLQCAGLKHFVLQIVTKK